MEQLPGPENQEVFFLSNFNFIIWSKIIKKRKLDRKGRPSAFGVREKIRQKMGYNREKNQRSQRKRCQKPVQ